jgi:hypothetical protein
VSAIAPLVVQTLWVEKIQSTTDAGSLNAFGRNEIEVALISSALLRIACLVILYKTCVFRTKNSQHAGDAAAADAVVKAGQESAARRRRTGGLNKRIRALPAPALVVQRESLMKRALTGIASVGILAMTVGVETANAQSYRRYGPARTYAPQAYTPQGRGSVRREGVPRTVPFSDPNSPEATGGGSLGYNRAVPHW